MTATAATALMAGAVAHAADPVEIDISGEASVVAGVSDGDAKADADAIVKVKGSTVLNNGTEVGAVVEGRLDGQQPAQMYAGGRYSGMLIGGPRGVGPLTSDAYVQGAYAYARGGFGQVVVGRDQGVARTLAVTSPTIFRAINVNDWRSDLSGLNDVHTVNDFSGYATKVTYMAPANLFGGVLGGLQMGVSYSPSLRNCGDRLCAPEDGFVLAPDGSFLAETSHWEDVVEGALYYQQGISLGRDRLLLGVGASVVTANEDVQALSALYGDYKAYAVGLNVGYRGITLGGSVKTTNAGLANLDEDGYLAFDAGITFRTGEDKGDWGFMLGYGQSEASALGPNPADPILFRDTQTAQAGVTYFVGRGITIGAAAQYVESTKAATAGGPQEATTVVIESSVKF
ncbi:MAG TPA: porin [Amphiplicatus sp.]|nr:porin [Amphiplicatus sp.]